MAKRCKSCGGVYEARQSDGTLYFHVCPPVTMVAVQRAGVTQRVPLTELRGDDLVRVQNKAGRSTVAVDAMGADDHRVGDQAVERPNKRDERPVERVRKNRVVVEATSEGDGVEDTVIVPPTPADVFTDDTVP